MKISLLVDHPEAIGKIAKWYYNEWAYLSLQITEEMMHQKVLEKAANRDVIPLVIVAHHGNELIGLSYERIKTIQNMSIGSAGFLLILYGEDKVLPAK